MPQLAHPFVDVLLRRPGQYRIAEHVVAQIADVLVTLAQPAAQRGTGDDRGEVAWPGVYQGTQQELAAARRHDVSQGLPVDVAHAQYRADLTAGAAGEYVAVG